MFVYECVLCVVGGGELNLYAWRKYYLNCSNVTKKPNKFIISLYKSYKMYA